MKVNNSKSLWVQYTLSDVSKVTDCKHVTPAYVSDGIPVVSPGTIRWGALDLYSPVKKVTPKDYIFLMDHCTPKVGDLVFSRNQSVGIASYIHSNAPFVLGQDTVLIQPFSSSSYLYYCLQTRKVQNQIKRLGGGTTFSRINLKDIRGLKVQLLHSDELRQKTADFFTSVDSKISQLTEKYRLLKDYKKGAMQQIFSQQIRFKDDDGEAFPEWKKEKIGRYLEPYKELVTADTNIPILTSSRTGLYLQERSVSNEGSYGVVPLSYFTYRHMSDDLIFKFNINTFCERGAVSKEYPVFKTVGMDPYFLQLQLNEGSDFKRFAIQQKLGGTRTRLYFKNLKELQLYLPCLKEQQKIAHFLQSLDKKINAVNQQIEQTKLFKKGLLQQMFV